MLPLSSVLSKRTFLLGISQMHTCANKFNLRPQCTNRTVGLWKMLTKVCIKVDEGEGCYCNA